MKFIAIVMILLLILIVFIVYYFIGYIVVNNIQEWKYENPKSKEQLLIQMIKYLLWPGYLIGAIIVGISVLLWTLIQGIFYDIPKGMINEWTNLPDTNKEAKLLNK